MESWLVISNSQTLGLANSLRLLSRDIRIDHADVWTLTGDMARYRESIPSYDRVIIHPKLLHATGYDFSILGNLSMVPSINFDAYHPDVCFAHAKGHLLNGPLGAYHSMIAVAAFEAGYDIAKTIRLFRRDIFERCQYFTRWDGQREQLLKSFDTYGLDMSGHFRKWSRGGSFMYGIDHSKTWPIHDIAHTFLEKSGVEVLDTDIVPADTIATGACFPVYPEVGETLGVKGSYMFKIPHEYKLVSLEQFIRQSFDVYQSQGAGGVIVDPIFLERYRLVSSAIAEGDLS